MLKPYAVVLSHLEDLEWAQLTFGAYLKALRKEASGLAPRPCSRSLRCASVAHPGVRNSGSICARLTIGRRFCLHVRNLET